MSQDKIKSQILIFDACELGIVLRSVLYVEIVLAISLLYAAHDFYYWLIIFSVATAGALPATLLWLLIGCSLKKQLAKFAPEVQITVGIILGALGGIYACGTWVMLNLSGSPETNKYFWMAGALSGALLASGLLAGLYWRARGKTPAAVSAKLAELQARIRPHFLFNTLNTAIALVRHDPAKAEAILEDLADLFRHALAESAANSTVEQEVMLAKRYLDIEQVRFGKRLRIKWILDERVGAAHLPPLILQPLVENAVKHGVEPSTSGADIRVITQLRGKMALIKVINTAPAGQGEAGNGIALENVRWRLKLLHDLQAGFKTNFQNGIYQARIEIPMP